MKYIHTGNLYLIFNSLDGLSHAQAEQAIRPAKCLHAGFVSFRENKTEEVCSYGESISLKLSSAGFNYDKVNYAGISKNDFVMISNSENVLKMLGCTDIQPVEWKLSLDDESGYCQVMYPGHPTKNQKTRQLLQD